MSRPSDELLMRLHDDELSDEELAELEQRLDAEDRAKLDGLAQVGDFVRALGSKDEAAADDIADAVMARIDAGEASRLGEPKASRWTLPAVGLTLAAAAALALWVSREPPPPAPVAQPLPTAPAVVVRRDPAPEPISTPEDEISPAVAIEAVDFGSHNGAIFMVSAGDEATTPVVWLTDDAIESGDRKQPL